MTAQTFSADPSGPPELDLAAMIRTLEAAGYTVRKARARKTYSAAGYDVRTCVHCGATATRITKVGARKPKDRVSVGLCVDCYRFGPFLHRVPNVPADPARYARLYRTWRRAHHRWARRLAAYNGWESDSDTERPDWHLDRQASALTDNLKKAMQSAPFVRAAQREDVAA